MAPQDLQHVVHFFLIVSITCYIYILYIYIGMILIDVRYSIMCMYVCMYIYIYIIAKHIVNTSEGSKKVGFGVVPYIYIHIYIHGSWGT